MNYLFTVPGHPQPKERARKGKHGNFYTPRTTSDYEEKIRMAFLKQYKSKLDDRDHKWWLCIWINFIGKKHGDVDNIIKIFKDALQAPRRKSKKLLGLTRGCIWHNDSQIYRIEAELCKTTNNESVDIYAEMMGRLE